MVLIKVHELITLLNNTHGKITRCTICNNYIPDIYEGSIQIEGDTIKFICSKCTEIGDQAKQKALQHGIPERD